MASDRSAATAAAAPQESSAPTDELGPPVPPAGPAPRRAGSERSSRKLILRLLVAVAAMAIWETYVRIGGTFATPPLLDVAKALVELPTRGEFWSAMWTSLSGLLAGFLLAVAVGLPLGVLVGRIEVLRSMVSVYLTMLLSVPLSAVVPVVVVLFGIGLPARLAVIFLFAFPVLTANVLTGMASVDRALLEMGASYGCTGRTLMRKILLPAILPEAFTGLRLAAGRAVTGMVVAELVVMSVGFGQLIDRYGGRFDMASLYAVVLVILLLSVGLLHSVRLVERRALSWRVANH